MSMSKRTCQRVISDGVGFFWRNDDKGFLYLTGIIPLCLLMGVEHIFSKWLIIPMEKLCGSSREIKAMLTCCVASRDERPVSVENLSERMNLSPRSIHYYMKMNKGDFIFLENNCVMMTASNNREAISKCKELESQGIYASIIESHDGTLSICKRLPNTIVSPFQRSGTSRIRYKMKMLTGNAFTRNEYQRLYAKNDEKGINSHVGMVNNRFSPIFKVRGGRPIEMWERKS